MKVQRLIVETMEVKICVQERGYGVDYGIIDIFQGYYEIPCDIKNLGKNIYEILNNLPNEQIFIKVEYNTNTSADHPKFRIMI